MREIENYIITVMLALISSWIFGIVFALNDKTLSNVTMLLLILFCLLAVLIIRRRNSPSTDIRGLLWIYLTATALVVTILLSGIMLIKYPLFDNGINLHFWSYVSIGIAVVGIIALWICKDIRIPIPATPLLNLILVIFLGSVILLARSVIELIFINPPSPITDTYRNGAINYYSDYVYYRNTQDGGHLYRLAADGSGNPEEMNSQDSYYISLMEHKNQVWVYYANANDGGKIYRVNANSPQNPEKVTDDTALYLSVHKNVVYYSAVAEYTRYLHAQELLPDGINHRRYTITDDVKRNAFYINAEEDGWVYYSTSDKGDGRTFRSRLDVNGIPEHESLSQDSWGDVNVIEKFIYYSNQSRKYQLFQTAQSEPWPVEHDERAKQPLLDESVVQVTAPKIGKSTGNYLVYLDLNDNKKLCTYNLDTHDITPLGIDGTVKEFVADEDWVYYINGDDLPYRVNKDGNSNQCLIA